MNFSTCVRVFIFFLRYTRISTDILMVTTSVTIGGLNKKTSFLTNHKEEICIVKESMNVIKII